MRRAGTETVLVIIIQILFQFLPNDCYNLESRHKRQEGETGETSTVQTVSMTTTSNSTVVEVADDTGRIGLVVGIICAVVAVIAAMALVVALWIKNKRSRDSEYARAAKVQRNSTKSAGVYNDLTTAAPIVKKPLDSHKEGSEMEKLKREEDEEV